MMKKGKRKKIYCRRKKKDEAHFDRCDELFILRVKMC